MNITCLPKGFVKGVGAALIIIVGIIILGALLYGSSYAFIMYKPYDVLYIIGVIVFPASLILVPIGIGWSGYRFGDYINEYYKSRESYIDIPTTRIESFVDIEAVDS